MATPKIKAARFAGRNNMGLRNVIRSLTHDRCSKHAGRAVESLAGSVAFNASGVHTLGLVAQDYFADHTSRDCAVCEVR